MTIKEFIKLTKDFDQNAKILLSVNEQSYRLTWDGYLNNKGEIGKEKTIAVIVTSGDLTDDMEQLKNEAEKIKAINQITSIRG